MHAYKKDIPDIMRSADKIEIPIYQRIYTWHSEPHCSRLWDDFIEVCKNYNTNRQEHFLGYVVTVEAPYRGDSLSTSMVIDGQQRLTTLLILLIAIRDTLNNERTTYHINNTYLLNHGLESDRYRFIPTKTDAPIFHALIEGDVSKFSEDERQHSRIYLNYVFFMKKLQQVAATGEVDVGCMVERIKQFKFGFITLEADDDSPQDIFESLNSTGLALTETDRIRNYLLMDLDVHVQRDIYTNVWCKIEGLFEEDEREEKMCEFIRDFLTSRYHIVVKQEDLYNTFKDYLEVKCKDQSVQDITNELLAEARLWSNYNYCQENDIEINRLFRRIQTLVLKAARPFILICYRYFELKRLSRSDFIKILELIINYRVRQTIYGSAYSGINRYFASFTKILKEHSENHYEIFRDTFTIDLGSNFISDKELIAGIMSTKIVNTKAVKMILSEIENFGNKEKLEHETLYISSIIPSSVKAKETLNSKYDAWASMLGNRLKEDITIYGPALANQTLTSKAVDSWAPFSKKKEAFSFCATHRLNSELARLDTVSVETLEQRAQMMLDVISKIWPIPEVSHDDNKAIKRERGYKPSGDSAANEAVFNELMEERPESKNLFNHLVKFAIERFHTIEKRFKKKSVDFYKDGDVLFSFDANTKVPRIKIPCELYQVKDPYSFFHEEEKKGKINLSCDFKTINDSYAIMHVIDSYYQLINTKNEDESKDSE